eukprot:TRINITY_DN342_c0_g1_i1.p1 TRINITY_DN342_c0_g1~~TRINITY_DN342_c0_g1_i1.p1  ORF type:complete len:199 (+),score=92.42 TRINITY_DN342_c0_g1_i1:55-651(+)
MAMRSALRFGVRAAARPQARFLSSKCAEELVEEEGLLADMAKPEIPAGWSVDHKKGNGFFRATKSADGAEVMIDCEFKSHSADATHFTVVVKRNNVVCDFTLGYNSEAAGLSLVGMATHPTWAAATDLTPAADFERDNHYEGPTEEDMQNAGIAEKALDFLEAQGVNASVGEFVHQQCQLLEQEAYIKFLQDVKAMSA